MMTRGDEFIAAASPFLALATLGLGFRLYTRIAIINNPGWEDFFVTLAWIFATGLFAIVTWLVRHNGLGNHVLELSLAERQDLSGFLKGFWVGIFFYNFSLSSCKASIFCQYLRLFEGWTKRVSWVCLAIVGCNAIWGFFINLFFCTPIHRFWDLGVAGSCLPRQAVWFSFAGANIATSVIAILVPIPAVCSLKMATRTKIALLSIFGLGILDIVLAVLRLSSLKRLSHEFDITYHLRDVGIWSSLESTVAIICASAPVLRPLLARIWPRFLSTNKSATESSKYARGSRMSMPVPYMANRGEAMAYNSQRGLATESRLDTSLRSTQAGVDEDDFGALSKDGNTNETVHSAQGKSSFGKPPDFHAI